jgi:hypothetical protein
MTIQNKTMELYINPPSYDLSKKTSYDLSIC